MAHEVGDRIGDYQIVDVLGTGGMGKVYKVRNVISERIEAMKVLLPNLESDPDLADRFMREIKVQASLQHTNIAALHTAQRVNNQLIMLIEFVEGRTLESELRNGPVPPAKAIDYVAQTLTALSYAHARGVVHRDIKPANIMVMPNGTVKLMDFGIARLSADRKLTQTGRTVGSLYYMSPEQIQGVENLDARTDLYSLGVTLYELLTNRRPFQGDSDYSIMAAHLNAAPIPPIQVDPTVPAALNDVILMAIAKDPAQRFQTADAFRKAIESVGAGLKPRPVPVVAAAAISAPPIPVASAPTPPPPAKAAAGGRRVLYMTVGSLVTIAVLVVAALQAPKFFGSRAASEDAVTPAVMPSQPPQAEQQPPPAVQAPAPQPETTAPAVATPQVAAQAPTRQAERPSTPQRSPVQTPPVQAQAQAQPQAAVQTPPAQTQPPSQPAQQAASADNERIEALNAAREMLILLGTRANAARSSLKTIRQQQERMGTNLRADVSAAEQRMEVYLDDAQTALKAGDPARARKNLDMAERSLEAVEKFLGR